MRRRRTYGHSSLTSLLDVLFILVFASLAHGASAERLRADPGEAIEAAAPAKDASAARQPAREKPLPDRPPAPEQPEDLHARALAAAAEQIRGKRPVYLRISRSGDLREIEDAAADRHLQLSVRLLEEVPHPDIRISYLGDRAADMSLCSIVLHHLGRAHLQDDLVIVVPDAPLADLPVALVEGLQRDLERCLRDQGGLAILVAPRRSHSERSKP